MMTQDVFKVVLCGNAQAGKTSILQRYCTGRFDQYTNPTVGADFISQTVYNGDRELKMHIWDTAGQEQYQAICTLYFRSTVLAIIVYAVTSPKPLEETVKWIDRMRNAEKDVVIVVFGNKIDLDENPTDEVLNWCNQHDVHHFFVSALTGENIQTAFEYIIQVLSTMQYKPRSTSIVIDSSNEKSCC